jgi:hypothetical protein
VPGHDEFLFSRVKFQAAAQMACRFPTILEVQDGRATPQLSAEDYGELQTRLAALGQAE